MQIKDLLNPRGKFHVEHYRKGKLIGVYDVKNGITNEGKDKLLDDMFNDGSQTANANWCISLIDNDGYSTVAPGDTMSSHTGWDELTAYDETNRVAWGSGAAASQSVTNATPCTFTMSDTDVVKGLFVTTQNTKGATSGTLWATALFSATVPVNDDDQLKLTYTVSA